MTDTAAALAVMQNIRVCADFSPRCGVCQDNAEVIRLALEAAAWEAYQAGARGLREYAADLVEGFESGSGEHFAGLIRGVEIDAPKGAT